MEGLSIVNFKSYRKHTTFGFSPFINVIIGGNGQGKSNMFKALSFVLSDRLQINRTQFNNCLHRGVDATNDRDIEVEVVIRQKDGSSSDLVKVAKVWKPNLTEECYVNSKLSTKKQFENFVDGLCLSYTNPYNIVQQGKINQIILMDEFQLYKLLEEITGVRKFNKRKEEALSLMNKVEMEKKEIAMVLDQLSQKLKSLENRKEQFEFFSVEQKTKKYRAKKHLAELLQGTHHNLQKIKIEYNEISESLGKIQYKRKVLQQNLQDITHSIKLQKEKLALIERHEEGATQTIETQELKEMQRKQKILHQEIKQHLKLIKEKDKEVENFKRTFAEIEEKYENMKLSKEVNKPKQGRQKVMEAFEAEIKLEQQKLQEIRQDKLAAEKKAGQIEKVLRAKKNMDQQQEHSKLEQQKEEVSRRKQQIKKIGCQLAWQKNVASIQCESLKQILHQSEIKLRKMLPSLDLGLLEHLKLTKVRGVYGYFIQFLTIDESVMFAYEIAGLTRLCSLLVENEEACLAVIEANRKLKGRQINIIQLDYLRSRPLQSQAIPKSENVRKLSNSKWIRLKTEHASAYSEQLEKDIQKLIKNTFDRYALVKDYETGLKVSKEYHLNCITADREIVYSEGYHCKLGQENVYRDSSLQHFYKFQQKQEVYLQKIKQKQQLQVHVTENENEEVKLLNKEHQLETQLNKISFSVNELKTQRKMLDSEQKKSQQLSKNEKDIEASLMRKKNALALMNSNNSKNKDNFKLPKAECDRIQAQYFSKRKELNKMLTEIYTVEEAVQKLSAEKDECDERVNRNKINKAGVVGPVVSARQIGMDLQQKQQEAKKCEQEIEELAKIQKEVEASKGHLEIKLITYRAQQEDIENSMNEIGEIQDNIEQLEQLSNSMSVSLHGRRKNYHFSAKDKLLFSKFSNIFENFTENKKTFQELLQAEQKIKRRIDQYQSQSDQYMGEVAERFEKQFIQIFGHIVNRGQAEVRLKKVSQKVRDVIKYKTCLTVMVSFSPHESTMKKWNDFSGGEKTVIAISMLLALQRCQPAPFYVLDEIDSALDSVYVQKIADLLSQESQRNKCQYFISSFKEDMMNFPEEICNYYRVSCQNRQSWIQKIKQSNSIEILRSFTVKK